MTEAMDGLAGVIMSVALHGWGLMNFVYTRTDTARNRAVHRLLGSDYEYLVMLDSDHVHDPQVVEKLAMSVMYNPEIKVLGGLTFRRGQPYEPMAYHFGDTPHTLIPLRDWGPGITPVDALSTAILMVHREVFESMDPPWFTYEYYTYADGASPSEDIVFFRRLRRELPQYQPYVHTQIRAPHISVRHIDEPDFRRWLAEHDEPAGESTEVRQDGD